MILTEEYVYYFEFKCFFFTKRLNFRGSTSYIKSVLNYVFVVHFFLFQMYVLLHIILFV